MPAVQAGQGAGEGGPMTEADKLAEARRKNREAQQRFRERQRAAARETEERYHSVSLPCALGSTSVRRARRVHACAHARCLRGALPRASGCGARRLRGPGGFAAA